MTNTENMGSVEEALEELRAGRMIVLVDDEHRENEGDLVIAAEKVTPEAINFMIRNGCGILCLALSPAICDRLHLDRCRATTSIRRRRRSRRTIDARTGITTGTSAFDRARTVAGRHRRPHHARTTWSAARATSTACAPARAACWSAPATPRAASTWPGWPGCKEAAVICEIMTPDGHMARLPDLRAFCRAARPEDVYHRGPDQVPPPARAADPPRAGASSCRRASASST